jgi:hypothetical protein
MKNYKKIQVVSLNSAVTGGPEALHHLVHELNSLGIRAEIIYFPFDQDCTVPDQYTDFCKQPGRLEDSIGNLVVFPEILPIEALKIKNADAAIWWLSVDNFLVSKQINSLIDKMHFYQKALRGQRPWGGLNALKNLTHYSQSRYSSEFLQTAGINFAELFEPINNRFLTNNSDLLNAQTKRNEILYNPIKRFDITSSLIKSFPDIIFTPLKGFTRDELSRKLATSKAYIDFGHHPGRDRLPREAAMHGCCVVTGQLGAAKNAVDIPIPSQYKLDHTSPSFVQEFKILISDLFENTQKHIDLFQDYRSHIMAEPIVFNQTLSKLFKKS